MPRICLSDGYNFSREAPSSPLALSLSLFHMTPLGSRLPGRSCLEGWLTRMGRRWFSASTVADHISHGCHPSSLTALARACWKSLRRPRFLPLKLDPKGFCALKPHLLLIPDHVMSQLSPIMSHLASQDAPDWEKFLVRVRRVCSCPGCWGVGRGCSGTWMTDSVMVCGCSPRQAVRQSWAAKSHQPQLSHLLV